MIKHFLLEKQTHILHCHWHPLVSQTGCWSDLGDLDFYMDAAKAFEPIEPIGRAVLARAVKEHVNWLRPEQLSQVRHCCDESLWLVWLPQSIFMTRDAHTQERRLVLPARQSLAASRTTNNH
jgi:hypothetical protein